MPRCGANSRFSLRSGTAGLDRTVGLTARFLRTRRRVGVLSLGSVGVDPRATPPPIPVQCGLAGVAGLAQGPQVRRIVAATMTEGHNVVNLGSRCGPSCFQAVLAQWVGVQVAGADLAQGLVVAAVDLRVTLEAAVALVLSLGVLGAEPLVSELRTTRVTARCLRLERHGHPSFPGCGKAPAQTTVWCGGLDPTID